MARRQNRQYRSSARPAYGSWQCDYAFTLGPFLQLPAYLPSGGQGFNGACAQWYGKGAALVPGICADLLSQPEYQMSAHAPSFVPAQSQIEARRRRALEQMTSAVKPTTSNQAASGTKDRRAETTARPIAVSAVDANMLAKSLARPAPSIAVSTSTGSCADSVQDDVDTMASARSEVTSEDTPETASQQENAAKPVLTASSLLRVASDSVDKFDLTPSFAAIESLAEQGTKDDCLTLSEVPAESQEERTSKGECQSISACAAVREEAVPETEHPCRESCASYFTQADDTTVIDPEARDEEVQISKPDVAVESIVAADKTPQGRQVFHPGCAKPIEAVPCGSIVARSVPAGGADQPDLEAVLGSWWDSKGSFYEVSFDEGSNLSCCVKTTRPEGTIRETKALIRLGQAKGKSSGRILWGSAFVLEPPTELSDEIFWRSIRGGRDFSWTRDTQDEEALEVVRELEQPTSSPALEQGPVSDDPKPEVRQPMHIDMDFSESGEKSSTKGKASLRRVWRAVSDKADDDAETPKTPQTPSEVAAASTRRVKSHSGTWRVIKKGPPS